MRRRRDGNILLRTVFRGAVIASMMAARSSSTSPHLRGEVGLRSNPGEGIQVYQQAAAFAVRAPHLDPLPAKGGERERLEHRQAPRFGPARKGLIERGDLRIAQLQIAGGGVLGGVFRA